MIPFEPGGAVPDAIAAAVDMRELRGDLDASFAGLFAGEPETVIAEDGESYEENDNWHGIGDIQPDARSMVILADELLLSSEASASDKRKAFYEYFDQPLNRLLDCDESIEKVEFLGNGPQYEGRCYGRVAILFWPRSNRARVQAQSKAGAAALKAVAGSK